jgi:hypothetical protein
MQYVTTRCTECRNYLGGELPACIGVRLVSTIFRKQSADGQAPEANATLRDLGRL